MASGGGDVPPLDGGRFLLQLLKNPPHQPPTPPSSSQPLPHDPAVAVVGPTLPFHQPPLSSFPANGGHDLLFRPPPLPPWTHQQSPPLPFAPHEFFNHQNHNPKPSFPSSSPPGFNFNQALLDEPQARQRGPYTSNSKVNFGSFGSSEVNFGSFGPPEVNFGSFAPEIGRNQGVVRGNLVPNAKAEGFLNNENQMGLGNRRLNGMDVEFNRISQVNSRPLVFGNTMQGKAGPSSAGGYSRSMETTSQVRRAPPGFSSKGTNEGNKGFEQNVDRRKGHRNISVSSNDDYERERMRFDEKFAERKVSDQFENPRVPKGSNFHSVSASDIEESLMKLHGVNGQNEKKYGDNVLDERDLDDLDEQLVDSLVLEDGLEEKDDKKQERKSRDKDYRSDKRGQWILNQRMRNQKRQIECRNDINRFNAPFLAIYESLIPSEEEKARQKQLLTLLGNHVTKEWPGARLYLYGSCANSFGFTKSDIDVCLAIEDTDVNKAEVLLKLANILQADNLENVQALTRARVPIVKLKDPATGISCDICVNNLLAVINTKLLRDYAKIDERLRQLAFIIKHWAKSRGVNETYQGTLSSYAYVLMCIHFLQQRRPSILPCLQGMERTYAVNVDNVECAYFDQVEKLHGFGSRNVENIAQLVWAFFNYWAHCHDYTNDVVSVRTGSLLSKRLKDWTRRIGNDRHLICIEDPFEVTHDLGRVVDKRSIRVLREEFERAADIMQNDPDPCTTLFQPYVPS